MFMGRQVRRILARLDTCGTTATPGARRRITGLRKEGSDRDADELKPVFSVPHLLANISSAKINMLASKLYIREH